MITGKDLNSIFKKCIEDYHLVDDENQKMPQIFEINSFEYLLYLKNWIDTVQWHLEDIIRSPEINPSELVAVKRRIDASNQNRTDKVEQIDDYFLEKFKSIPTTELARINSETPAWLIDRMSILQLKLYHFREQVERSEISSELKAKNISKLEVLTEQESDLENCFDELMDDYQKGIKKMKVYRQMKMYNDPNLNPVLYQQKK